MTIELSSHFTGAVARQVHQWPSSDSRLLTAQLAHLPRTAHFPKLSSIATPYDGDDGHREAPNWYLGITDTHAGASKEASSGDYAES